MLVVVSLVFLGLHIKMHCSHSKHNCVFFSCRYLSEWKTSCKYLVYGKYMNNSEGEHLVWMNGPLQKIKNYPTEF